MSCEIKISINKTESKEEMKMEKLDEKTRLECEKLTGRQECDPTGRYVRLGKQPEGAVGHYGTSGNALFFVDSERDLYVGRKTDERVAALRSAGVIIGPMVVSHNLAHHYEMMYGNTRC